MSKGKCDIESARLGFEALVHRIREVESGVKDVSYNSRKTISNLRKRIAALEARLRDIARSGVSFSDPRVRYVEIQVDRDDWEELQNDFPPSSAKIKEVDGE